MPAAAAPAGSSRSKREPLLPQRQRPATAPPMGGGAGEGQERATTTHEYWAAYAHRSKLSTSAIARRWGPLLLGAGLLDALLAVVTVVGIYRGDVRAFWDGAVKGCVSVFFSFGLGLGRTHGVGCLSIRSGRHERRGMLLPARSWPASLKKGLTHRHTHHTHTIPNPATPSATPWPTRSPPRWPAACWPRSSGG